MTHRSRRIRDLAAATMVHLACCGGLTFQPPTDPPHDNSEDGALHPARNESPFLCGTGERAMTCPPDRPAAAQLPCDASGCHGGYDFAASPPGFVRHLFGGEGPSCYSCHDDEWNDE